MTYLEKYLKRITDRGNIKLAESVAKTAEDIGNKYIKNFSFMSHEVGLLFGNVQSGKTGQMFGVISKAADLGFSVFLLLTTDNIVLQQQTIDRVKADLPDYCICGENDDSIFLQNELMQAVIIVIKKNVRVLRKWSNVFASTGFMRGNPLFIIDDEADAASLNTLVNKISNLLSTNFLTRSKMSLPAAYIFRSRERRRHCICRHRHQAGSRCLHTISSPEMAILAVIFSFPREEKATAFRFWILSRIPREM